MSPKEKAEELVNKMYVNQWRSNTMDYKTAKQCALIAVDEILHSRPIITDSQVEYQNYWQEVKQEIEKL
jgi:uncharacterized membrane protein